MIDKIDIITNIDEYVKIIFYGLATIMAVFLLILAVIYILRGIIDRKWSWRK